MCDTCGCNVTHGNAHLAHEKDAHGRSAVTVLKDLLSENDRAAAHNRAHFDAHGVLAVNLMSAPGAGKTALLEATIEALEGELRLAVIEGDLETENDANRIRAKGVPAYQITTGTACHLDAHMVHGALHHMALDDADILFVENVGNLVCPAAFDLGQHRNVVLLSVPEGDDKPAKYPVMFRAADLVLLTKADLLPVLDDFERGLKMPQVKAVFDELRPRQVALVRSITERGKPVDNSLLHRGYDVQKQWEFGLEVARAYGYDFGRGRQDKSAHPFTTTFGWGDVRITTRLYPNLLSSSIFSTMHETGHALYDQGSAPELDRSPLLGGSSLAIHESQSRLWENLVGRSLPFWKGFLPRLQDLFAAQLADVDLMPFYRAINKVEPSLIRVEADEATYNLHIMLRFELEIALAEDRLPVADLPAAWNEKTREYLGLTPPNDAQGVMQDVHWSSGALGYFPTYALGNLVASQLWEKISADLPGLAGKIERAEFGDLLEWLRFHIHRHGSKFEATELLQRVVGGGLSAAPYLKYLETKFGEIYGL